MPGPRHPGGEAFAGGKKAKNPLKTIQRILSYIRGMNRFRFIAVLVCIFISAIVSVIGSMFLQTLIDDYITPLLGDPNPVFTGLLKAIGIMGLIYLAGILSAFLQNWFMATVSQGVLKDIRDDMFTHMQTLPIRYFDTHTHGDTMSRYTNDTDTMRQLISQSVPQLFSSLITIVSVFVAMITTSVPLTLLVLAFVALMMVLTRFIGSRSGKYFKRQQKSLGAVNGYIEEMVAGQKVIKVFCHEEKAKEEFDRLNTTLRDESSQANIYSNIMGPVMGNLGHLQYVLIAVAGGALALGGVGGLTLGGIAAFLQLSRSFTMPISQVSQQFNMIVMALAGAERVFDLMDKEPEQDEGYVTLVNAREENGEIVESKERTGMWA